MMQAEESKTLKKICFDIFEQLAFMFGDELEKDDVQCPEDDFIQARMKFSGHKNGAIEIIIPARFAPSLAYNILGVDESGHLESEIAEDALKELLNTLCGRMLPSLFTDRETFDLYPPEVNSVSRQQWQEFLINENSMVFAIEDSPILLNVHFVE
jgi:CheY-specific phosphatase CheX